MRTTEDKLMNIASCFSWPDCVSLFVLSTYKYLSLSSQTALVVIFPHPTLSSFLLQMSVHMRVTRQPRLAPHASFPPCCTTCPFCCQNGGGGGAGGVRVYSHQSFISCQHFGHNNMPTFKLMTCQRMWWRTVHTGRGRSFHPNMLIVSLMYKFRVKKRLIYTLLLSSQMWKLRLATDN